MSWLESHQTLGRHPKLLRLAGDLGIHRAQAIGHLQYLWWWALDFAPNGDLSTFASTEISTAAEWCGDPKVFYEALRRAMWIDPDGTLHDWQQYAGPCLMGKERQKRYREKRLGLRHGDVTNDVINDITNTVTMTTTIPNLTIPDIKKKKSAASPRPVVSLQVPEDLTANGADIETWLAYKREKGKSYKPIGLSHLWASLRKIPAGQRKAALEYSMANNYEGIFPPKDAFFQRPAGAQTPASAETSERLKREKQDMIAQEMAFSQAQSALKSLPAPEFESIHAEALKRLPRGLAGQKFKESLLPPLMVEVWRERKGGIPNETANLH